MNVFDKKWQTFHKNCESLIFFNEFFFQFRFEFETFSHRKCTFVFSKKSLGQQSFLLDSKSIETFKLKKKNWIKTLKFEKFCCFCHFWGHFGSFCGLRYQPKQSKNFYKYKLHDAYFTSVKSFGWNLFYLEINLEHDKFCKKTRLIQLFFFSMWNVDKKL